MTNTTFDPERFLRAQEPVFTDVLAQLRNGRKTSHWMWFVFPQLQALGRSETARFYGLVGAADAAAYNAHPLLGARLRTCCELMLDHSHCTANEILRSPDDLKLRSCVTLFRCAVPEAVWFDDVLRCFYSSLPDPLTLNLLDHQSTG
jgi:uncharacterized protein (DUF1810 family)